MTYHGIDRCDACANPLENGQWLIGLCRLCEDGRRKKPQKKGRSENEVARIAMEPLTIFHQGDMIMSSVSTTADVRERVGRWIEDGQNQLSTLLVIVNDYDRLRELAESTERECQRLREYVYENERIRKSLETSERDCELLREEVRQLRSETERHRREREAIAETLSQVANEVAGRLRQA